VHRATNWRHRRRQTKKDIVMVFNKMIRREVGSRMPTVDYISTQKPEILTVLCEG